MMPISNLVLFILCLRKHLLSLPMFTSIHKYISTPFASTPQKVHSRTLSKNYSPTVYLLSDGRRERKVKLDIALGLIGKFLPTFPAGQKLRVYENGFT